MSSCKGSTGKVLSSSCWPTMVLQQKRFQTASKWLILCDQLCDHTWWENVYAQEKLDCKIDFFFIIIIWTYFTLISPSLTLYVFLSRRSSDQLDLMVDGLPVSLPTYEEAVYGSWGQRLPPCSAPGPTQLLMAQEAPVSQELSLSHQCDGSYSPLLSSQSPDNPPPPPYEEVQPSRPGDRISDGGVRLLRVSDDKDTWLTDCQVLPRLHLWPKACSCPQSTVRSDWQLKRCSVCTSHDDWKPKNPCAAGTFSGCPQLIQSQDALSGHMLF